MVINRRRITALPSLSAENSVQCSPITVQSSDWTAVTQLSNGPASLEAGLGLDRTCNAVNTSSDGKACHGVGEKGAFWVETWQQLREILDGKSTKEINRRVYGS